MQNPPKSSHSTTVEIANSKKSWALTSDAFLSWLYHHLHPGLGVSCPKVTNSTPRDAGGKEDQGDLAI